MPSDEDFMQMALEQARLAACAEEVPIGAIITKDNAVIAAAWNQVETLHDATAHAEMLAIRQAIALLGDWRLNECTLYVTKEPCAMCAGALVNSRLGRLVFGCPDPRSGGAGSALDITGFSGMLHRVPVTGGILAQECLDTIGNFFKRRREENKPSGNKNTWQK